MLQQYNLRCKCGKMTVRKLSLLFTFFNRRNFNHQSTAAVLILFDENEKLASTARVTHAQNTQTTTQYSSNVLPTAILVKYAVHQNLTARKIRGSDRISADCNSNVYAQVARSVGKQSSDIVVKNETVTGTDG
jgi:hypothetical protein